MTDSYGRLMIDVDGKSLSEDDKFLISKNHVGGLTLFLKILILMNSLKSCERSSSN